LGPWISKVIVVNLIQKAYIPVQYPS